MNQIIINILITLSWVSLVAFGFSLIYNVAGFFHIAHGVIMYMGASIAVLACNKLLLPIPFGIILGILFSIFLGICAELFVYKPVRKKNPHPLVMLLSSIGLMFFFQSIAGILWRVDPLSFNSLGEISIFNIMGARITIIQIYIMLTAFVSGLFYFLIISISSWGTSMRAVANNQWLAKATGIPTDKIILITFSLASGLAGLAGSMIALDIAATPDMAMNALLLGVVAAIIGGANPTKIVFGALIVSMLKHLTMWFGSTLWSEALMFGVLLIFLIIKGSERSEE